jgi:hypothetical protein
MSDEMIFNLANNDMCSEIARGVSLKSRKSFEKALDDAEDTKRVLQASFARKGGKACRSDALQELMIRIVRNKPQITTGQLLRELAGKPGEGTITRIDCESDVLADGPREIHYIDHDGRPKSASIPGLKDRLSRIKAKLGSR